MDVSQYLEIFIDETSEHIQSLNDCIMTLERSRKTKIPLMKFSVQHTP